ncbi:single-stranded DNA-binding protein [Methanobrevibacter sp.]|uniref:single-stranded DNA-binding protein n=1 Tax=Methanobrevibacter sp. TaxID=66852 RepID=UPI00388DA7FB
MLNVIALVGRLTREPQLFKTNSGNNITKFALAFNQGKNPDGTEDTGFIEVTTFDKTADICGEWLSKGDKIAVTGRIYQKKFIRQDGSRGSNIELMASGVEFIDILKQSEDEVEEPNEEELPFDPDPEVKVEAPKAAPQNAKPVAKPTRSRR